MAIGKEITVNFRQNQRMILFCELLGLFRSLIQFALCSARKMQLFGPSAVEISQSGMKLGHFLSKSMNDRVLRVAGFVSKRTTVCKMFCA
jgi:hypothetical protein